MNNTDFEFDFDFKPITDGLGFHHENKIKQKTGSQLKEKSEMLRADLIKKSAKIAQPSKPVFKVTENLSTLGVDHTGELAAFYNPPKLKAMNIDFNKRVVDEVSSATMMKRMGAFLLDIIILFVSLATLLLTALILGDVPLSFARESFSEIDFQVNLFFVVYFCYSLYFAFFDTSKFSTIGKNIFGLTVTSVDSSRVTLIQSFVRANIVLIGFLTLGLVSVLDLHSRFTSTLVKYLND